jgi:hypothetical protein
VTPGSQDVQVGNPSGETSGFVSGIIGTGLDYLPPGDPGLYQINAVAPAGIVPGDSVQVVISVAGQTSPISPPVTMAVR